MNKKLIFVLGGAAALYFLFLRKKGSAQTIPQMPVTADRALAPAFVQTANKIPASFRRLSAKRQISPASELMTVANEIRMDDMQINPGSMQMDEAAPILISRRDARQTARSIKQEVKASGGTAKQSRQAARSVRKDARQIRRMGDMSVLF